MLLVELDPRLGTANADGVVVALTEGVSVLTGSVTDRFGNPIARAVVQLSDGTTTFEQLSADAPPGQFAFTGLPPGSYTVTASRQGSRNTVIPLNLQAGGFRTVTLQLGEQAAISGRVLVGSILGGVTPNSPPASGYEVRLFLSSEFPNGDEIATATTGADGEFQFLPVDGNVSYVVAVYLEELAANNEAVDSLQVLSQESAAVVLSRPLVVGVVAQ